MTTCTLQCNFLEKIRFRTTSVGFILCSDMLHKRQCRNERDGRCCALENKENVYLPKYIHVN